MSKRPTFEEAKRDYPNRYTVEHVPQWAHVPFNHSTLGRVYYAPQYQTDREWYDNTVFFPETRMPERFGCVSMNPTWPNGKGFLSRPFHLFPNQTVIEVPSDVAF